MAGTLGLCQKVEICSPRYLVRGWAVLEVEALAAKDFANLDSILKVAQGLIFSGVSLLMKLKCVGVVCCGQNSEHAGP